LVLVNRSVLGDHVLWSIRDAVSCVPVSNEALHVRMYSQR